MATDNGVVLVHGGGFGASCWDLMVPHLTTPSIAVDLPGRGRRPADLTTLGIDDFARAVVEDIEGSGWDQVVLVGHSLAGITLPAVAALVPERIAHLVFVSCSVPAHGQSTIDTLDPEVRDYARANIGQDGPADRIDPDLAVALFGTDLNEQQTAWMLERTVPEASGPLSEPCDLSGLTASIPRTWIRLLDDVVVPVAKQDAFIANIGGADVVDLDAAHMAMISRPVQLAGLIDAIASRPAH